MKGFEYKCMCDWSKDNKYGFIPNTECLVHGKKTKKVINKAIRYEGGKMKLNPIVCKKCNNKLQPSELGVDVVDYKLMRVCGFCGDMEEVK